MLSIPLLLVGCQAPERAVGPTTEDVPIADYEAFVDNALTVLREHDLQPEVIDRSIGLIRSEPTTSKQWFEFWRGDAPGGYQTLESSLHTIRRTVTVTVAAPETSSVSDGRYAVGVEVQKERFSQAQRQVTTTSGAIGVYSRRLPARSGLLPGQSNDVWVSLGRDVLLERRLLARLIERGPVTSGAPGR